MGLGHILCDTNIWIAYLVPKHALHKRARTLVDSLGPASCVIHPKTQRELGIQHRRLKSCASTLWDAPGYDLEIGKRLNLRMSPLHWPTDAILLIAVARRLVDALVTEDREIHADAERLDCAKWVWNLTKAEQMLRGSREDT